LQQLFKLRSKVGSAAFMHRMYNLVDTQQTCEPLAINVRGMTQECNRTLSIVLIKRQGRTAGPIIEITRIAFE
jgi:hypothetical protein